MPQSSPQICLYFQVHQPYRLGRYTCFQVGNHHDYFDVNGNREILKRVAQKCYIPAVKRLASVIQKLGNSFAVSFSFSGTVLEQLEEFAPNALEAFQQLATSPRVEILGETYHHTLCSVYAPKLFCSEVSRHAALVKRLFNSSPKVFRNTELVYSDEIGSLVSGLGYSGIVVEEWADSPVIECKQVSSLYRHPQRDLGILTRSRQRSDDIAFRFTHSPIKSTEERAKVFLDQALQEAPQSGPIGIFVDFETFGEHLWETTGILDFLEVMPTLFTSHYGGKFVLPSETIPTDASLPELSVTLPYSWADTERDLSAWNGNSMQRKALAEIYSIYESFAEQHVPNDPVHADVLIDLMRLLTSDHFYYMSNKSAGDGAVHSYFSPYESPYDAFIRYMNVLRDLRSRVDHYRFSLSMHHATNAVQPV